MNDEKSRGATKGGMVEELQKSLAMSNNGYLFSPAPSEAETAHENPLFFVVAGGLIYARGHLPEQYPDAPQPQRRLMVDGPDYEALILSRQERAGFYN